ncbi:MAG TPA: lipid-A-disaccharide synthase [Xanthobacteraceae bacterium]|jgi:lipid-A-disaccharide synthase|nr:lipid-A-disaccharide synthase [Xanthobacteraceae bacterium]
MNGAPQPAVPRPLSIVIVAAEESGDALGAALARALRAREGEALKLLGVGGRAMAAAGIASPFPIDDLAIVGLTAIPQKLPLIFRRIRETVEMVIAAKPDALVIVDSPDFTHRVARRVRRRVPSIPIIDYVSPQVWAWRPGRARTMRAYVDHVLAILPFEPAEHQRLGGPPCTYVGHPLSERLAELRPNAEEAKRRQAEPPVVLALPGSRGSEIKRLLSVFGETLGRVAASAGTIDLMLPTVPHLLARVREGTAGWPVRPRIVVEQADKWAAFRSARAALAASGTVTLELALAGIPTVAAYRVHELEAMIARLIRLRTRLPSLILANLVIGENVMPELIQEDCTVDKLTAALLPLLSNTPEWRRQVEGFSRLDGILGIAQPASASGASNSAKAADIVLAETRRGRAPD